MLSSTDALAFIHMPPVLSTAKTASSSRATKDIEWISIIVRQTQGNLFRVQLYRLSHYHIRPCFALLVTLIDINMWWCESTWTKHVCEHFFVLNLFKIPMIMRWELLKFLYTHRPHGKTIRAELCSHRLLIWYKCIGTFSVMYLLFSYMYPNRIRWDR